MTKEMAGLRPDYIYLPLNLLVKASDKLSPFLEMGVVPVAVLPRIIKDVDVNKVQETLLRAKDLGIKETLCGNLGAVSIARKMDFTVRGDYGLNVFNSWTESYLKKIGLSSVTLSFELRLAQIRSLVDCINSEIIAYGRLPLMVTDQQIIKEHSSGNERRRQEYLHDHYGAIFPVIRTDFHQNEILNSKKLFLADKIEELYMCKLWALRLLFTTESSKECFDIANSYMGYTKYKPNELTRGLYYRGVT